VPNTLAPGPANMWCNIAFKYGQPLIIKPNRKQGKRNNRRKIKNKIIITSL
jgi:hypothetical protein